MNSIIENLYYGNIPLSERGFRRTSEYAHVLQLAARNEEKLAETLTDAQKETFGKFKDNTSELSPNNRKPDGMYRRVFQLYSDYIERIIAAISFFFKISRFTSLPSSELPHSAEAKMLSLR